MIYRILISVLVGIVTVIIASQFVPQERRVSQLKECVVPLEEVHRQIVEG